MAVFIDGNGINYGTSGVSTAATITGFTNGVYNAYWSDYVDAVLVNEDAVIEPGYAYAFDGKKYFKTEKYADTRFFGMDSDTYGQGIGFEEGNMIRVPVAGFVLAYIDKEYEPGTPLTCTKKGILTEANEELLKSKPYMVIATYWRTEPNELLTDGESRIVKVNGRHWVKIK